MHNRFDHRQATHTPSNNAGGHYKRMPPDGQGPHRHKSQQANPQAPSIPSQYTLLDRDINGSDQDGPANQTAPRLPRSVPAPKQALSFLEEPGHHTPPWAYTRPLEAPASPTPPARTTLDQSLLNTSLYSAVCYTWAPTLTTDTVGTLLTGLQAPVPTDPSSTPFCKGTSRPELTQHVAVLSSLLHLGSDLNGNATRVGT